METFPTAIAVVDSHTEGEPTRVIVEGWPEFREPTMEGRRAELVSRFDALRRGLVLEPRGFEAIVGAVLTPPTQPGSTCGVVFFNNVGPLWMCGHGLIGVVRTLEFLGRVTLGTVAIDTPAGTVRADLAEGGVVTVENVPSYCHARDVSLAVPEFGEVVGDVAYGGNWFFLAEAPGEELSLANRVRLTRLTGAIRTALRAQGITGAGGAEIDHVELFGPASRPDADSRNWVLCPGGEYDRSPCGTGTSAKLAVLHAHGKLAIGQRWRQESITGSRFIAWLERRGSALIPHIQGHAYVTAEARLLFDPADPFREGLSAR